MSGTDGVDRVDELSAKVHELLAQTLQVPESGIADELTMNDVPAWDSLKHMELIVAIESAFGVELSFEEIVQMRSVGEIKAVLREKCAVG